MDLRINLFCCGSDVLGGSVTKLLLQIVSLRMNSVVRNTRSHNDSFNTFSTFSVRTRIAKGDMSLGCIVDILKILFWVKLTCGTFTPRWLLISSYEMSRANQKINTAYWGGATLPVTSWRSSIPNWGKLWRIDSACVCNFVSPVAQKEVRAGVMPKVTLYAAIPFVSISPCF